MALTVGASLYLASQETLASPYELLDLLRRERISTITLPPSLLQVLPHEDLPDLRILISAGEACPTTIAQRWAPGRRLFNAYGPTETSIGPTFYEVGQTLPPIATVPIGRPIHNMRTYVLDRFQQPVPVGVPGELYVAGVGLARGYLNQPALTAERFIPNPFQNAERQTHEVPERSGVENAEGTEQEASATGEIRSIRSNNPLRLYRTGDLVRWLPDGDLQFLGRVDHQVKLRGFRIELGEVEAVLRDHELVSEAVALVRDDRLIAYVVPALTDMDGHPEGESQELPSSPTQHLRLHLRQHLPEYMVPSAFVFLDELPLTPNGKVDRKALPDPEQERTEAGAGYIAPRDQLEARLAQVFEEVLEVRPVGVKDNFFDLGGHSLLAVRLIAKIQQQLGATIPLVALFQGPTVEHLAGLLREEVASSTGTCLVPLKPTGSRPPLFFIHPSGGSVHWYMDLAEHLDAEQPLHGLQAHGLHGGAELDTTIEAMASRYVAEMREAWPQGPFYLASWSMGVIIAYEVAQQLRSQGQEVAFLGMLDQGPAVPDDEPEDDAEYLVAFFGRRMPVPVEYLRTLAPDDQLRHVMEEAKRIRWLYPDITLDQFRHFFTVLKTHSLAWRAYHARPYPGRITLFRSEERQDSPDTPQDLGWAQLAQAGVDILEVPGDHNTMLHEPYVEAFVSALREQLAPSLGD